MPLETANYIPELVETNPDGTDLASTLDNHDRLIKTAIKGSFPAFVGTTGAPKSVSKTEDQINDAAELSANNSFTGDNDINGNPIAVKRVLERTITGNGVVEQTDEQRVIRYTGAGGNTLLVNSLLQGTVVTIKNVGTGDLTLSQGTVALTWLEGGTTSTGSRTLAAGSVIELHYATAGIAEIWGNGLS